jgi:DUF4097 and DUF4098 domain-containing protein YvlB
VTKARENVEASDSGGNITIGEGDRVVAQTSSGFLKIKMARGGVQAANSGGDILIQEAGDEITARTSSGTIEIGRAKGKVTSHNSGGSIKIKQAEDIAMATTSSGQIQVHFINPPKAECRLEVSGGAIEVGLPEKAGVDLDAKASGGKIASDLPLTITEKSAGVLEGKVNGGGSPLILRSSSGDIRLRVSSQAAEAAEK